jgi:hypothetical protein
MIHRLRPHLPPANAVLTLGAAPPGARVPFALNVAPQGRGELREQPTMAGGPDRTDLPLWGGDDLRAAGGTSQAKPWGRLVAQFPAPLVC